MFGPADEHIYTNVEKISAGVGMFHYKYMNSLNLINENYFLNKQKINYSLYLVADRFFCPPYLFLH